MVSMIKLNSFEIETDWDKKVPANKEIIKPVFINRDKITSVQERDFSVPGADGKMEYIPKVLITFELGVDIWVNESLQDVVTLVDPTCYSDFPL